ncbi:MAG: hypothetical protein MUP21_06050 [Dehalococcoidia bacterium]|nr:hypothetical protein [Dehalococcoidia bacterium]
MDFVALQGRLNQILVERSALDMEIRAISELFASRQAREGASYDPDATLLQEELAAARALRDAHLKK